MSIYVNQQPQQHLHLNLFHTSIHSAGRATPPDLPHYVDAVRYVLTFFSKQERLPFYIKSLNF